MDLSSRKIESIPRIDLPNPKINRFFFFGGGILGTFLGKSRFANLPSVLG